MKLLYLHEALGSLGGAEANVLITATEFSKRGVEVGLVTQKETGKNTEKWKALFRDNIFYYDQAEPSEIIDKFQPNVVYTHKWSHLPTLENWVKCDIPMARMVHDHESYCLRGYKYFPVSREICRKPAGLHCVFPCLAMLKINRGKFPPVELQSYSEKLKEISLCRQMDAQFVVTDYMQNELLINGFSEEKIHIFPPVPREVEPVNSTYSDRNLIIFAGQIIRGKGVDLLVKALSQMKEPFECVVLGEGSHQSRCQQLCDELQVADKVRFAGFIPQRELQAYYKDATVLVVPSVWPEPIATIGLEAMKSGLPVVGFDSGGIQDWLKDGENGFLVPWMDTKKFAEALDTLMRDKQLAKRMGENGLQQATQKYNFNQYIDRLHNTLMGLSA